MGQFLEKPKVEKHNERGKNDEIRYGLGSMQGWRVDMEDAHTMQLKLDNDRWSHWSYFGIFDGHAGFRTAVKASEKLHHRLLQSLNQLVGHDKSGQNSSITSSQLDFHKFENSIKDAYFKFDQDWREENRNNNPDDKSGSTAISCLIDPERIYFLNVGDSRAILVSTEGRVLMATKDHKPSDHAERQRIQEAGGTVLIQRVNGSLAVSRALGDFEYKNNSNRRPDQQLVSPEPEIYQHLRIPPSPIAAEQARVSPSKASQQVQLPAGMSADEQTAFIVLACDGIWDVITNEELAAYVLGRLHVTDDLADICNQVLDMCLYKGSKDNMSLIIMAFKSAPAPTAEWKSKDEAFDKEIRKKTEEIFQRNPGMVKDANSIWQQVVTSLNENPSIREAVPVGGGFISKRSVFETHFDSLSRGGPGNATVNNNNSNLASSASTSSSGSLTILTSASSSSSSPSHSNSTTVKTDDTSLEPPPPPPPSPFSSLFNSSSKSPANNNTDEKTSTSPPPSTLTALTN